MRCAGQPEGVPPGSAAMKNKCPEGRTVSTKKTCIQNEGICSVHNVEEENPGIAVIYTPKSLEDNAR
jgi:hypothetical protein